jgi:hypothetical protein
LSLIGVLFSERNRPTRRRTACAFSWLDENWTLIGPSSMIVPSWWLCDGFRRPVNSKIWHISAIRSIDGKKFRGS